MKNFLTRIIKKQIYDSIPSRMRYIHTHQANQFARTRLSCNHLHCTRFVFAGPLVQINSTILRRFYCLHYEVLHSLALLIGWRSFLFVLVWSGHFPACFVFYDVIIFKLSFPLTHDACYVVADSHICHEPSTGWQVIQLQPCEGQNKNFVCRLFLNFCCPYLPSTVGSATETDRDLARPLFPRNWSV